jgi:hypothetical protein
MGWRMRPLAPAADRGWMRELWAAALPPTWPPLPAGIAMLRDGLVAEAGAAAVLAFEAATFPSWVRWFGAGDRDVLVTRAWQLLGQAGTRTCHIGCTTRESFYRPAGYRPWRRYAMFS